MSPEPAVRLVCDRCGAVDGRGRSVRRTPHSIAEVGRSGNPPLCAPCDREVSR
jgi:hypothetical protein